MKIRTRNSPVITSLNWTLSIFLLVMIGLGIYLKPTPSPVYTAPVSTTAATHTSNQKQTDKTPTPSISNTPSLVASISASPATSKKIGFYGYSMEKRKYNLALPPECNTKRDDEELNPVITCSTTAFTIKIRPETGGTDTIQAYKSTNVKIGNIMWIESIFQDPPNYATYAYSIPEENVYMLGVTYTPFIPEAEEYFKTILASFHFID